MSGLGIRVDKGVGEAHLYPSKILTLPLTVHALTNSISLPIKKSICLFRMGNIGINGLRPLSTPDSRSCPNHLIHLIWRFRMIVYNSISNSQNPSIPKSTNYWQTYHTKHFPVTPNHIINPTTKIPLMQISSLYSANYQYILAKSTALISQITRYMYYLQ